MASLKELRDIEEERITNEREAIRAAELARIAAREAEARAKVDAELRKVREEHEAKLAIENARFEAEREARLKIEAAEVAERTRQQAILAEARLAQEMELRRAEIAKKRPTWMLVVTGIATLAAFVLIYVAIDHTRQAEQARAAAAVAEREQREMRTELDTLTGTLNNLQTDTADLEGRITKDEQALKGKIDAAKTAELEEERRKLAVKKAELLRKQQEADELKRAIERKKKIKIDKKCQDNVIC